MRFQPWIAALIVLLASPAPAQMTGGPNSMSAIPGTELPDKSGTDVARAIRGIDEQNGGDGVRQRETSAAYHENLRIRREQAKQYAAAARSGVPLPGDAAETVRNELAADIEQWRMEFRIGHKEAEGMRREWLVDRDSISALQWAQRRVDWWAARDAWVAHNRP